VQLWYLGECFKLPQRKKALRRRGLGRSPSGNQIWYILAWKSDIWWHGTNFSFSVTFQKNIFFLTFPWPLKFPDFFQFSLTYRNPGTLWHVSCLQVVVNEWAGLSMTWGVLAGSWRRSTSSWCVSTSASPRQTSDCRWTRRSSCGAWLRAIRPRTLCVDHSADPPRRTRHPTLRPLRRRPRFDLRWSNDQRHARRRCGRKVSRLTCDVRAPTSSSARTPMIVQSSIAKRSSFVYFFRGHIFENFLGRCS